VDENTDDKVVSLSKRAAANRRNAQLSTGPRTEKGKSRARYNAPKHGILASDLLITQGVGAEDPAEFDELLDALSRDLEPVGALEEILVERIAKCCWRGRRAQRREAGLIRRAPTTEATELEAMLNPERAAITDHHSLPLGADLDRILRYEAAIHRQLVYAINQLERSQRTRKGELVLAPLSVQLSNDR